MNRVVVFLLCLVATAAQAGESPLRIAVLDVRPEPGVDPGRTELFAEFLQSALRERGHTVLGKGELTTLMGAQRLTEVLGCLVAACYAGVGDTLGVDELLRGSIARKGDNLVISLRRLSARDGVELRTTSEEVTAAGDKALVDAAPRMATAIFAIAEAQAPMAMQGVRFESDAGVPVRVQVDIGGSLLTCDAAVTASSPCFLAVPAGTASVRIDESDPRELAVGQGTWAYRIQPVDPAMPYGSLATLVAGVALTVFGATTSCPDDAPGAPEFGCTKRVLPLATGIMASSLGAVGSILGFIGSSREPTLEPLSN